MGAVGEVFLEQFAQNFSLGCQLVGDAIQNYLMPLLGFLQQVVQDMLAAVSEAWAVYGQPILDRLAQGCEQLRGWVQTLYYELIRPVLDELMARLEAGDLGGAEDLLFEAAGSIWPRFGKT